MFLSLEDSLDATCGNDISSLVRVSTLISQGAGLTVESTIFIGLSHFLFLIKSKTTYEEGH